ncbi:hypothetical protein I2483_13245 [Sporosarcina sp. E16_3]|uniref:hypothetical protein n=1 Tax=Sporosarcina sp. E16_3 TaxID=2789293 RepID=UPI001A91BBA7|nr:hypothetical protein [Sporosarcina sp. E16_3]MBO0602627.1 hypothetical protein [Sporosarcina sp. E16_3]
MKSTIKYRIEETLVQVIHDDGEVVVKRAVWVEGEGLCAIYDLDENWFPYVCTLSGDLGHMLATHCVNVVEIN